MTKHKMKWGLFSRAEYARRGTIKKLNGAGVAGHMKRLTAGRK